MDEIDLLIQVLNDKNETALKSFYNFNSRLSQINQLNQINNSISNKNSIPIISKVQSITNPVIYEESIKIHSEKFSDKENTTKLIVLPDLPVFSNINTNKQKFGEQFNCNNLVKDKIQKNNKKHKLKTLEILTHTNLNKNLSENKIFVKNPHQLLQQHQTKSFVGLFNTIRYLDFRPYVDSIENPPNTPKDCGYYFKMVGTECPLIRNLLYDNGLLDISLVNTSNKEFSLLWSSGSIKGSVYQNLKKFQKVNHFPRSVELTRKDLLYINISKLQVNFPHFLKSLSFIPQSFLIPNEYKFLEDEMNKDKSAVWIVKPVSSSQGRGIFVTNTIQEVPTGSNLIVSKYIQNPYLINGYKFDMRIYVVMTSLVPMRIYIYEEGFARFATEKYYLGQPFKSNKFMHLTNYAVNKVSKNFVPNLDPLVDNIGSKWSLNALRNYFKTINVEWIEIQEKIDDLIIKTFISAEGKMFNAYVNTINQKNSCFELFGFDILLDSNLNPWLMEVNLSPSLHIDSPLDIKIKGELIAEILDLSRIIPLDLRDKESEFIKISPNTEFENKIMKETAHLDIMKDFKFTKEIREVLWDIDEERKRTKNFRALFPAYSSLNYRKFFNDERQINLVLSLKDLEEYKDLDYCKKSKKVNLINKVKIK